MSARVSAPAWASGPGLGRRRCWHRRGCRHRRGHRGRHWRGRGRSWCGDGELAVAEARHEGFGDRGHGAVQGDALDIEVAVADAWGPEVVEEVDLHRVRPGGEAAGEGEGLRRAQAVQGGDGLGCAKLHAVHAGGELGVAQVGVLAQVQHQAARRHRGRRRCGHWRRDRCGRGRRDRDGRGCGHRGRNRGGCRDRGRHWRGRGRSWCGDGELAVAEARHEGFGDRGHGAVQGDALDIQVAVADAWATRGR